MSIKRRMRWLVDHAAHSSGVLRLFEKRLGAQPTILTYHRVLPDARCDGYPFPSLVMPVSMFTQQVEWLAHHADVVLVRDLATRPADMSPPRRPRIALTFDDGYLDNATLAAPILARHGLRGTFFVTTGFVGQRKAMWYDRAAAMVAALGDGTVAAVAAASGVAPPSQGAIAEERLVAWIEAMKQASRDARRTMVDQLEAAGGGTHATQAVDAMLPEHVADLAGAGHEIGAHSVSHEMMTSLDDEELRRELTDSRRQIEAWTGTPVSGFCYPNGTFDARVSKATRAAGYQYACTTAAPRRGRRHDLWSLPRVDITPARVAAPDGSFDAVAFRAEVCGFHEALR